MDQVQRVVLDPLKPYLVPVTTNLPQPVADLAIGLLGERCYSALLLDLDVASHPECVSLAVSKALGIGIVAAASIVKVPQIIKLVQSGSSEGLSFTSYVLETASFVVSLAYSIRNGFPFTTYGETALIAVQDVVISVLILVYSNKAAQAGAFLAAVGGAVYALIVSDNMVNDSQMTSLQAGSGALSVASKLPQILTIWNQGGTGQLSAFAVFNYLFGSLIRIYTTLQEVDDKLILYGYVVGFLLNTILALQVLYYWRSGPTAGHAKPLDQGKERHPETKSSTTPPASAARPSSSGRRRA